MRRYIAYMLFGLSFLVVVPGAPEGGTLEASATIRIDSGSFLKELGFQLVEASVSYEGKMYRVRFYNVSDTAKEYHASGTVYGLTDIEEIVGRYEPAGGGRVFVNEAGVEITMDEPMELLQPYLYVDYLGSLYARHDQSVQFGPRE